MLRVLRDGDGAANATEGVVAAIAAAGGNDKVVFAAGDRIAKDDLAVMMLLSINEGRGSFAAPPLRRAQRSRPTIRYYISLSFLRRA